MEIRLKPLIKGAASFIIPPLRTTGHKVEKLSSENPEFCYSIFLRHYSHASPYFARKTLDVVAELGPGSSLGVGLCALICGAKLYYALDFVDHTDQGLTLHVFDELVEMFRLRRSVPRDASTFPEPAAWKFPADLVVANDERLAAIRDDLLNNGSKFIRMAMPWTDVQIPHKSIGWLWSHSVLEHVDNIEQAWKCCATWLTDDGVMTHNIDYGSHGLTKHWDGHRSINDLCWTILRGRRPYLINRMPHSAQVALAKGCGFEIASELIHALHPHMPPSKCAPRFGSITARDRETAMAFMTILVNPINVARAKHQ
jgi:hypothetical protein